MILHLAQDNKFIDYAIGLFEKIIPGKSTYFVFVKDSKNPTTTYIKNKKYVEFVSQDDIGESCFIKALPKFSLILIHSLDESNAKFVINYSKYHNGVDYIWIAWGFDFYNINPDLKNKILTDKTKKILPRIKILGPFDTLVNLLGEIKSKILSPFDAFVILFGEIKSKILTGIGLKKDLDLFQLQLEALKHIEYAATMIYDDYTLIRQYYKKSNLKYIKFSYGGLSDRILKGINLDNYYLGNHILLGNSSHLSNNHLDIIDILSQVQLDDKYIYLPLSYGNGNKTYQKAIIKYGQKKLNSYFKPIVDYLPIDQYNLLLSHCGYFIGNYRRQQGMGVIHTMLYLGAKIFLNKENPTFSFLKREGVSVFEIEDIIRLGTNAFLPLNINEIKANRDYLDRTKGDDKVEDYIKKIVIKFGI